MIKNWGAAWAFLALVFLVVFALWLDVSTSLTRCQNGASHCGNGPNNESTDYMTTALAVGKFLDDHNGAVSAVAAIFIAAFTVVLAQKTSGLHAATRGLQEFSALQADDMKRSIAQTTRGADAAHRSADAAKEALALSNKTAERQLRAYVHIHDVRMSEMNSGFDPNIQIVLKNFGQTPAREITNTCNVVAVATQPMESIFKPGNIYELADLAPGQQVFSQTTLPSNQWATWKPNIITKTLSVYVFGRIDYVDAFGESRFSEYRLRLPIDTRGIIDESSLVMDNRAGNRTT
jgi:hypothetical protein